MIELLDSEHQDKLVAEQQQFMFEQSKRDYAYSCDRQELLVVTMYGLKPYKDGDQWCILLGDNIQEGIVGFGKSPIEAIRKFNTEFYKNN